MYRIKPIIEKTNLKPVRYEKYKSIYIIDTKEGKFVIKKTNNNPLMEYLKVRNFTYFPKIINQDDEYQIMEYIEEANIPKDQKISDLIDIVSLLHYKTTHFKAIDKDEYKEIYEDINNNVEYLFNYYDDLISLIEQKEFMSPAEYVLARNISKIYQVLDFVKNEINIWYDEVKNDEKRRVVVLHNNLDLSHFIRNDESYLISFEKSKIGSPIFDLYKLYKRHGNEFEFDYLFKRYEEKYPLLSHEKRLLFILISMPDEIKIEKNIYSSSIKISEMIDLIYKTEKIISPYYSKEWKN